MESNKSHEFLKPNNPNITRKTPKKQQQDILYNVK